MTTNTNSYDSYGLITPYVGKRDRHTQNQQIKHKRMYREAAGKAGPYAYTDGDKVDPETMSDINRIVYNNKTGKEELNETLNLRSAVLHRIQKGIVPVENYPISPRKNPRITPVGEA